MSDSDSGDMADIEYRYEAMADGKPCLAPSVSG
jgi:hypothetical protein